MPDSDDQTLGPAILGTRLTVYHLLESFLDPEVTESDIGRIYKLTAEQVAKARAFVLRNSETVLAEHLKIEERLAAGNPPEVRESAERARAAFKNFRDWLADRRSTGDEEDEKSLPERLPTFREWLVNQGQP